MRTSRDQQALSYPLRLPDEAQADALRLLDVSREVINTAINSLWDRLDDFGTRTNKYAYKQVEEMTCSPQPHGDRQWRCEAEQAGRILRSQAERKKQFALILPILEQGMIRPKTNAKRAGKHRKAIKQALTDLREANSDGGNTVELQSLIEQACNFYLTNGCFPDTYEEMQAVPVLKAGILPYAGDDGPTMGQSYRLSLDLEQKQITLALRTPDETGTWARTWRDKTIQIGLPEVVLARMKQGKTLAPSLREIIEPEGTRYAVLDFILEVPAAQGAVWEEMDTVLGFDWGVRTLVTASVVDLDGHQVGRPFFLDTGPFDGQQARTRRQIDQLKKKVAFLEAQRDRFAFGDQKREPTTRKLAVLRKEIALCWRKYEARNRDLAHLAANVLLLLTAVFGCHFIAGESLKSLKSTGRGRDTKGKWRNWRNNSQVRGELWRVLRYKCVLAGVRLEWQQPRETSHTCPHCGAPAATYRSPEHLSQVEDWGRVADLSLLRLERRERLCSLPQHRSPGRDFHRSLPDNRPILSCFDCRQSSQTAFLYGKRVGATVAADGSSEPLALCRKNVHQWLEAVCRSLLILFIRGDVSALWVSNLTTLATDRIPLLYFLATVLVFLIEKSRFPERRA